MLDIFVCLILENVQKSVFEISTLIYSKGNRKQAFDYSGEKQYYWGSILDANGSFLLHAKKNLIPPAPIPG